jgi:AcrR family transcriptional regulator
MVCARLAVTDQLGRAMTNRKAGPAQEDADDTRGSSDKSPGLRELSNRRRRRSILACARQQFLRKGFEATTIAGIARAARTATRTVYNIFPSKIDLLGAVLREEIEKRMTAELAISRTLPAEPYEGVLQLIEMQARVVDTWPRQLVRLFTSHAFVAGVETIAGRMHASSEELFTTEIRERLEAYRARGSLPAEIDVGGLSRAVFSVLSGCYYSWLSGNAEDVAEIVTAVREQLAFVLPARTVGSAKAIARASRQ